MEQTDVSVGKRPRDRYDVVVLGGGLAGLALGRQLKRARPGTSVAVIEQRRGAARDGSFKVGESTVEVSAHYFSDVLGLRDHLERDQVRKSGQRFFFSADGNDDIAARYEWGPADFPVKDTYHLDRGRFETALWEADVESGVDVLEGCRAEDVELGDEEHTVTVSRDGAAVEVRARWSSTQRAARACSKASSALRRTSAMPSARRGFASTAGSTSTAGPAIPIGMRA